MSSSAPMSQRSPNFEQPMPRMATLSLMPLAIEFLRISKRIHLTTTRQPLSKNLPFTSIDRRRLPEVTAETAFLVEVLDAEDHAHLAAAVDRTDVDVGDVGEEAPALFERHHAVMRRRVLRVGEVVGRP